MISLELSQQECELILSGLFELPAKYSIDLISKIREQAISQIKKEEQA